MKRSSPKRKISRRSRGGGISLTNPTYMSFLSAFLALSGTTILTVLASFSDIAKENTYLRQALVSESCVNIVAGLTYSLFIKYLYEEHLTLEGVTPLRYLDWAITTPLLLFSFTLYVQYFDEDTRTTTVDFTPLIYIIAFNFGMLYFGFLGETGDSNQLLFFVLGFGAYAGLFYFLYEKYVDGRDNTILTYYIIFAVVWGLYGLAYLLPIQWKNIVYNILDVISKAGFGILIWVSMIQENPKLSNSPLTLTI
tara:strand:- start:38 stop:793 length:756 start_codon:yes stop_codon:yes gene_type:complete